MKQEKTKPGLSISTADWDELRKNSAAAYNDLAQSLLEHYDEDEDLIVVQPDVITNAMSALRFLVFMLGEARIEGHFEPIAEMRLRAFGDADTDEWKAPMSYKVLGKWLPDGCSGWGEEE
jgi:hypothetical protein